MADDGKRRLIESYFEEGTLSLDVQAEYESRHDDYIMEMPQSGERVRGRDNMRAMQEAFPTPPKGTLRRIVGDGLVWVVEGTNEYGEGDIWSWVFVFEFEGDLIRRETRYYCKPFEPPPWRAAWVEPIE